MNTWPFVLYAAAVVCWFALHLLAAFRALKRLRGDRPPEIDMGYVRIRDYQGRAVREGISPSTVVPAFVPALPLTPGVLLCESDCVVQTAAQVTAIVSLGSLTLKERVGVGEFADCRGEMIVADECSIGGPATSGTAIRLGRNVRTRSVFAPEITTNAGLPLKGAPAPDAEPICIPPCGEHQVLNSPLYGPLRQLSDDTWLYLGDLLVTGPLLVTCKLVVFGSLSAPAGSVLKDDIKTTGDLIVGEDCLCRGSLVSDRDIELGCGTRFERSIYAARELRMKAGVQGQGPEAVAAFARFRVLLDNDILVRGRIASEGSVISE